MKCSNCGVKLNKGVRFCEGCGVPVEVKAVKKKNLMPVIICSCVVVIALGVMSYFAFFLNEPDKLYFVTIDEFVENWNNKVNSTSWNLPFYKEELIVRELPMMTEGAPDVLGAGTNKPGVDDFGIRLSVFETNSPEDNLRLLSITAYLTDETIINMRNYLEETLKILDAGLSSREIKALGLQFERNANDPEYPYYGWVIRLQEKDGEVELNVYLQLTDLR